jgi:Flp pilus assembly protein TadG
VTTPDRGTAVVGTLVGVLVFLVFLCAAVQLLLALYATSTVTAVATDAARSVASRRVDHTDPRAVAAAEREATAAARRSLGTYGRQIRFDWTIDRDTIRLHVRADNPRLAMPGFAALDGFTHVDRTVVLRLETPT